MLIVPAPFSLPGGNVLGGGFLSNVACLWYCCLFLNSWSLRSSLLAAMHNAEYESTPDTVQLDTEGVGDFIRRLERNFRIAYGRDGISAEARDALLYSQLHEGLRYEIMRAPSVWRKSCAARVLLPGSSLHFKVVTASE